MGTLCNFSQRIEKTLLDSILTEILAVTKQLKKTLPPLEYFFLLRSLLIQQIVWKWRFCQLPQERLTIARKKDSQLLADEVEHTSNIIYASDPHRH